MNQKPLFPRLERNNKIVQRIYVPYSAVGCYTPEPGENGILARWLAPVGGSVRDIVFWFDAFDAQWIKILIDVSSDRESRQTHLTLNSGKSAAQKGPWALASGDRLIIRILESQGKGDQPASIRGIWTAFIFDQEPEKEPDISSEADNDPEKVK